MHVPRPRKQINMGEGGGVNKHLVAKKFLEKLYTLGWERLLDTLESKKEEI